MPRIVHFEIYADDVDRASKFYTDLFGWEINKWDGLPQMDYRLVTTGQDAPGINGSITGRPHEGVNGLNYVDVESIEEYLGKVQAAGGTVLQPKMPIPGVGYLAVCQDTEGNPIGFFQTDEGATHS